MTSSFSLPRPLRPMLELAALLRRNGFAVSPDQTMAFIEGVGLLGPRGVTDIYRAGRATFGIPRERVPEFDALFRAVFLGMVVPAATAGDDSDDVEAHEATGAESQFDAAEADSEAGLEAAATERLGRRGLVSRDAAALSEFARNAPARLPRRKSYRWAGARRGEAMDLRRTLRATVRHGGDVFTLREARRRTRQRRIVLLIDVSGSMKERTQQAMQFAHALMQAADRAEVFTLGTRLTRITSALALANRDRSLEKVASLVADIDGGTRIGDALQAFLRVPRFAGLARGAAVVVLSDGLERGRPEPMADAVRRLSRIAWRLDWLSPLAADPGFRPQTEALASALPWIHALGDGGTIEAIASHVLKLAKAG